MADDTDPVEYQTPAWLGIDPDLPFVVWRQQ